MDGQPVVFGEGTLQKPPHNPKWLGTFLHTPIMQIKPVITDNGFKDVSNIFKPTASNYWELQLKPVLPRATPQTSWEPASVIPRAVRELSHVVQPCKATDNKLAREFWVQNFGVGNVTNIYQVIMQYC